MSPPPPENVNILTACCACNNVLTQEGLRFPKNLELRTKWVEIIMSSTPDYPGRRELLEKTGIQLCVEHFETKMLILKVVNENVTYALRKGGYPSIFDDVTQHHNGHVPSISNGSLVDSTTKSDDEEISICYEMIPMTSEVKAQSSDSNALVEVMDIDVIPNSVSDVEAVLTNQVVIPNVVTENSLAPSDTISSVQEFIAVLKGRDAIFFEPWRLLYNDTSVLFAMFDAECQYLIQSFTVNENLVVSVYYHGQPYTNDQLTEVLGEECSLDTWKKFKDLIVFLHKISEEKQHYQLKLKHACKLIQDCIDNGEKLGFTKKEINKWKFSLNQLQISDGQNKFFTQENLQWAMNAYNVNRAGYAKIYESEFLTLPHPASLELSKRQQVQTELVKRQQQLQTRPKVVPKKLFKPSNENGMSVPFIESSDMSLLRNRNQIVLNNNTSTNHSTAKIMIGQKVLTPNKDQVVDDDICEIQL